MQQAVRTEIFVERNLDLSRKILKAIEKEPKYNGTQWYRPDAESDNLGVLGQGDYSWDEVAYNLNLLIESSFVLGKIERDESMPLIKLLTGPGHDFIGNITDDAIWEKTKEEARKIPGASLEVVAKIATDVVLKFLGLS